MNTFPRNNDNKKRCLALAVYDNLAETPDELAFRRGDTLVVLEQNSGGLEGWWLCSLRGRQGICPGNRLRIMPGRYDSGQGSRNVGTTPRLPSATPGHSQLSAQRRSWSPSHAQTAAMSQSTTSLPQDVTDAGRSTFARQTTVSVGPVGVNDTRSLSRQLSADTYDSPPAPVLVESDATQEDYDTPRPLRAQAAPSPLGSVKPRPPLAPKPRMSGDPSLCNAVGALCAPPISKATTATPSMPLYSEPRSHQVGLEAFGTASNRCSGISTTSAGSSVRSSSDSSSSRSSMEPAAPLEHSPLRRPPQIPENGTYSPPRRRVREHLYEVPQFLDGPGGDYSDVEGEDYDVPQHVGVFSRVQGDTYDVPPANPVETGQLRRDSGGRQGVSPLSVEQMVQLDIYDAPKNQDTEYDSPNDTLDTIDTCETYDSTFSVSQDVYDVPRPAQNNSSFTAQNAPTLTTQRISFESPIPGQETYDFPRSCLDTYDSPQRTNKSPSHQSSRDSLLSTGTSCRMSAVSSSTDDSEVTFRTHKVREGNASRNATYWLRSAGGESSGSMSGFGAPRELPLSLDAGLETVQRLEQELNSTVTRLFSFVVQGWRSAQHMEGCAIDLKLTVVRMRSALRELIQFAYGAMVATSRGPDQRMGAQFVHVLKPLEESVRLIESAANRQDSLGWTVETLARRQGAPADALDQLLACAQSLNVDTRQLLAFIRGNASLIFSRKSSDGNPKTSQKPVSEMGPGDTTDGKAKQSRPGLMGDYDYVCLATQGSIVAEHEEVREQLPEELRGSFDNLMKESQVEVKSSQACNIGFRASRVDANDQQVLDFYREQANSHYEFLNNAIDAFFATIQNNQPPKVFVAHSKFVILSAHKLVYISDTVHRIINNEAIKRGTQEASDSLFASLKKTVQSTKTAALRFPSAPAVQQMADHVLDVSRAARQLKAVFETDAICK